MMLTSGLKIRNLNISKLVAIGFWLLASCKLFDILENKNVRRVSNIIRSHNFYEHHFFMVGLKFVVG